jgi:alpha-amylase
MSSQHSPEPNRSLIFYFQVHQPKRLRNMRFFDIGSGTSYFDDALDNEIIQRVTRECYLPANALLLKLIQKNPDVKFTFSISGVVLDQLEEFAPEVIDSFRALHETGFIEFLSETYYHSLSSISQGNEFDLQVLKHREKIRSLFGAVPTVFRNTELIYNDAIGSRIRDLGFKGIFTDGIEKILESRSPHHIYTHPDEQGLNIFLRNYHLSDDIAFRFSQEKNSLTVDKYLSWLNSIPENENVVNLAMDYETFGEHHKKESGIFTFFENLITAIARENTFSFSTPSKAITNNTTKTTLSVPNYISWADRERDLSAWLGNEIQRDAFDSLMKLESDLKNIGDNQLLKTWRYLQASDHFYYMSTKKGTDGGVHNYFSPYSSPYEAFINYMNVLTDFTMRVKVLRSTNTSNQKIRIPINRYQHVIANA